MRFGIPRNDFLFKKYTNDDVLSIREKYDLSKEAYIVLYAPTFRDDYSMNFFDLDFESIKKVFSKKYGKQCIILIRLHPNVIDKCSNLNYSQDVLNYSYFPNYEDLIIMSDCVISDYSSIVFDYFLIGKPVYLYVNDEAEYISQRGVSDNYFISPFPKLHNQTELEESIMNLTQNDFNQLYLEYKNKVILYDNGEASEQVVKWIQERMRK